MRFEYSGTTYQIEFQRERQLRRDSLTNEDIETTHPSTTARILVVDDGKPAKEWKVYRSWTVGCYHRDRFTTEQGRLYALRAISKGNSLPREFKARMWDAYITRTQPKMVEADTTTTQGYQA